MVRMTTTRTTLPRPPLKEVLAINAEVIVPTLSKGAIHRRRMMMSLAERLNFDGRATRRMQLLRQRYGAGPLLFHTPPGRNQALILHPDHVKRVLDGSPEPFATASQEKHAALSHFQPRGVLISHGAARAERRRFNEEVLEPGREVHHLAERMFTVVNEEAERLLSVVRPRGTLTWDAFAIAWFRMVRRVVFGDAARDDEELADSIVRLRSAANWAFFHPIRKNILHQFHNRVNSHLANPQPGTLASVAMDAASTSETAPSDQIGHWLFAFDPAGMNTYRTLALLAAHPGQAQRAREEIGSRAESKGHDLPFLRACAVEALRLWPTTPVILRETTEETMWENGIMPANTSVIIFAPFFHRDGRRLSYANQFVPDLWLEDRSVEKPPLVPFSGGPAICPGRNLVLLLSSAMLAALLDDRQVRLKQPHRLDPGRPLPGSMDHYSLDIELG